MTTPRPEALAADRADMLATLVVGAQMYRGRLSKVTTGDWQVILATLDAARPETGLREALRGLSGSGHALVRAIEENGWKKTMLHEFRAALARSDLALSATPPADARLTDGDG